MCEVGLYRIKVSTGSTKDIAVANRTAGTYRTACDVNRRRAATDSRCGNIVGGSRSNSTHRTHGTGTIDVAHHGAAIDVSRGIAIHDTSQGIESITLTIVVF